MISQQSPLPRPEVSELLVVMLQEVSQPLGVYMEHHEGEPLLQVAHKVLGKHAEEAFHNVSHNHI